MNIKSKVKKAICAVLIAAIVSTVCLFVGCNDAEGEDENEFYAQSDGGANEYNDGSTPASVAVIGSPRVMAEANLQDVNSTDWQYYKESNGIRTVADFTEAIFKTAVDDVIAECVDCVIIVGDLTEDCSYSSMKVIADGCAKLANAGISVFVTGGTHDIPSLAEPYIYTASGRVATGICQEEDYTKLLGSYGFGATNSTDSNSRSYSADINGTNYTIVCLDNTNDFNGHRKARDTVSSPAICDGTIAWLEDALQSAEKRGKTPIFVSYFPLSTSSIELYSRISYSICYTLDRSDEILALLAKYNVHTAFSAHGKVENYHVHSVGEKSVAELSCSPLASYPCAVKYCKVYKSGTAYITKFLPEIGENYLPSYTTAEQKESVKNLTEFAGRAYEVGLRYLYHTNIFNFSAQIPQTLYNLRRIKLYATENCTPESNKICEDLTQTIALWMYNLNSMPICGEGDTIEAWCKQYNITVPENRFASVYQLILYMSMEAQAGISDPAEQSVKNQLLYDIFMVGIIKLCDLHIMETFHQINPLIEACDITPVVQKALRTGTLDLTENELLRSLFSLFLPMIDDIPVLAPAKKLIQDSTTQELLSKLAILLPILTSFTPEIDLFINENGDLETSYMSFEKGEIYVMPFVTDVMLEVVYRTSILYLQ